MTKARAAARISAAMAAGSMALQPVAQLAEVAPAGAQDNGCNAGSGWTYPVIAHGGSSVDYNDAWRAYAAHHPSDPPTTAYWSAFIAYGKYNDVVFYSPQWSQETGRWQSGHFDELVDRTTIFNNTHAARKYDYRRSCVK